MTPVTKPTLVSSSALGEARAFFEGSTERPLDHVEALAWDLAGQLEVWRTSLEAIANLDPDWTHRDPESVFGIARHALAAYPVKEPSE